MYATAVRRAALELLAAGRSKRSVSLELGISRAALRAWAECPERSLRPPEHRCWRCNATECPEPAHYAYLLGQYLGDGYLVTSTRVPKLRVACANAYPAIAGEVDTAMTAVSGNRTGAVRQIGCTDRYCYWMHWPCVFPQHGPGTKHTRPIVLADWQRDIVREHPWPLIRGLIHSDGCRAVNRVVVRGTTYRYPRYFLSNKSVDILMIFADALDSVGVEWRRNRVDSISVARRASVALMDEQVGPKC